MCPDIVCSAQSRKISELVNPALQLLKIKNEILISAQEAKQYVRI